MKIARERFPRANTDTTAEAITSPLFGYVPRRCLLQPEPIFAFAKCHHSSLNPKETMHRDTVAPHLRETSVHTKRGTYHRPH